MGISTHILDTALGRPAAGVEVTLAHWDGAAWAHIRQARSDPDGRVAALLAPGALAAIEAPATLRLRFETAAYFATLGQVSLYPYIEIVFTFEGVASRYHIPLLLTANGYTTYRGS